MTETESIKKCILSQLPLKWQNILKNYSFSDLEEIRFRLFSPVILYYSQKREVLEHITEPKDTETLLMCACRNSLYSYTESIKKGFVTLLGGHRMGISGRGVLKSGEISGISRIFGINIRIAKEIKECSDSVFGEICERGKVKNTLILSPPAAGKTTLLRDITRKLSENFKVCVIDERSEIAALTFEEKGFDIGIQTDVYDMIPKTEGIFMALRSLSPEVIVTDEVDTEEDLFAVKNIIGAGAKIIASAHCEDFSNFKEKRKDFLSLFDVCIILSRRYGAGTVEEVLSFDKYYI